MGQEQALQSTADFAPEATIAVRGIQRHAGRGLGVKLGTLAYRVVRRLARIELAHVLSLRLSSIFPPRPPRFDLEYRFLDAEEIRAAAADPWHDLDASMAVRLQSGHDFCFAALHGDRLASYAWYAVESIEAEHSYGAGLSLPRDTIYMYKAFTVPEYRGQQIHGTALFRAARHFQERGAARMIAIIEYANWASLRSHEKLGFQRCGRLLRIRRKTWSWGIGELVRPGKHA